MLITTSLGTVFSKTVGNSLPQRSIGNDGSAASG